MRLNPFAALRGALSPRAEVLPPAAEFGAMVKSISAAPVEVYDALQSGPTNPQTGVSFAHIGINSAGMHISHERACMVAAVWACMDVIASALASSDWNVYAGVRGAANKQSLPNDSLQYILNTRFNDEMTAQAGKRAMGLAAAGFGNGYAEIEWDLSGRMVALWPISPDRVEPVRNREGRFVYRVTQDFQGGFVDLDPSDVFHIRGGSMLGSVGDDIIGKAIQTIAMSVAVDQFGSAYFGNGTQLGGILEYVGRLDDAHFERTKAQWNTKHQGARQAFKTAILEGGMKFTPVTSDAEKAQMVEAKYQIIEEVCRWFRVPPHKVAHLLRATNNNIEHQGLEFSRDTLRPWVQEIQQEADYKLIPFRGPKKFLELDVDWAEQGDYGSRATAYSTLIGCGVLSPNDVLRKFGENTIGTDGDVRFVNGAAVRLEDVGKNMLPTKPAPAPAEPSVDPNAVVEAWLTSVYARIQRRFDNGARNMQAAGHSDWRERAREATKVYAVEHVDELADVLAERLAAAQHWAIEVINGCEPKVAALAVMESK